MRTTFRPAAPWPGLQRAELRPACPIPYKLRQQLENFCVSGLRSGEEFKLLRRTVEVALGDLRPRNADLRLDALGLKQESGFKLVFGGLCIL